MQTILLRDYVCVLNKGVACSTYESWIYKRFYAVACLNQRGFLRVS